MQFTRAQLAGLVDLHNSGDYRCNFSNAYPESSVLDSQSIEAQTPPKIFQVLIVDVDAGNNPTGTKLVYGTKKQIETLLGISNLALPSTGVVVEPAFVPPTTIGQYSTVRFLLQCRKLSQMMTYTWLEGTSQITDPSKLAEIKLIREIFHGYNVLPDTFFLRPQTNKLESIGSVGLKRKMLEIEENRQFDLSYLIKPASLGYSSIRLVMLLCGQAYYGIPNEGAPYANCKKIGGLLNGLENGIFSTYDMIWEYALDLTWDSYYATRIDISQSSAGSGVISRPPYTKLTLGYPAKPTVYNVNDNDLKTWATAKEQSEPGNEYPFYITDNGSQTIGYVVSPYPYVPLSCT